MDPNISGPTLLKYFLRDICSDIREILCEKFTLPTSFTFNHIKNMKLLVGGGTTKNNEIVRKAFSLLLNQHELTTNLMSKLLNEECYYVAQNLFNNTKIINPITYKQIKKELNEARGNLLLKLVFFINI
jgi:hypothetical protein